MRLAVWGPRRHPDPGLDVVRDDRFDQDGQALARLVATEEKDGRAGRRPGGSGRDQVDVDAVPNQLVAAPEGWRAVSRARARDGAAQRQALGRPAARPSHGPVPGDLAGPVEGAHQRPVAEQKGGQGRAGDEGLVEVDDVEALVPQRPDGAQGGRRVGGDGGHRAVAGRRHRAPRGETQVSGGGPSQGASTLRLDAHAPHRPGDAEHLVLHAARDAQAVRADDAYAHDAPARPRALLACWPCQSGAPSRAAAVLGP